jgi:hypothetical protein
MRATVSVFLYLGLIIAAMVTASVGLAEPPCSFPTTPSPPAIALSPPPPMVMMPMNPSPKSPPPTWEDKANDAANKGCRDLKSVVTPGNFSLLGFEKIEDVNTAQVGHPFDIYAVGLRELRDFLPGRPVVPLLAKLPRRLYPLTIRGEVRSALVVTRHKNTNEAITTNWGLVKLVTLVAKHKKADSDFVVWIPSLNFHFLGDRYDETLMLTPLANRPLYGLTEGVPVPAGVVFSLLAPQAKAHDESNPG